MIDPAHDRLHARVMKAKDAALEAVRAGTWVCSDGHDHPRPGRFTLNRLATEVERRHPRNDWTSSEISLAIFDLMDDGTLKTHKDWSLSVV